MSCGDVQVGDLGRSKETLRALSCRRFSSSPAARRCTFQARSQGGFGGCGRTPPFLGAKKKSRWCPRLAAACSGCDRACMHRCPCVYTRRPTYTARNRILKVLQCRSTSNDRHSFECPLSTSSVVFCVDWKVMRLKFTNEPSVL